MTRYGHALVRLDSDGFRPSGRNLISSRNLRALHPLPTGTISLPCVTYSLSGDTTCPQGYTLKRHILIMPFRQVPESKAEQISFMNGDFLVKIPVAGEAVENEGMEL